MHVNACGAGRVPGQRRSHCAARRRLSQWTRFFAGGNNVQFEHLTYVRDDRVATITLNRPDRLNAIARGMPQEIRAAVDLANADDLVHVILLQGAGRAFCAGYDLKNSAEQPRGGAGSQEMPWDPFLDFLGMDNNTQCFQSLWRSYKPTICKIHGYAVAGGTDIALSCDLVMMAEN